ncbi:putative CRISPR-associated protein [Pelagibius sp. Alg239-R121]|uniref:putative CRISPR-associated protein n=1 Tax=Pelagibius sp. Alg239-R121 TaxID=2993448 RepID=UPI0024A740B8|nr:putative CRISPR-associated protein [Pelagibius sp. Alg239-R121]
MTQPTENANWWLRKKDGEIMAYCYLCTAGTSAGRHADAHYGPEWIEANGGVDQAAQLLLDGFRHTAMDDPRALTGRLPAEVNSLARLGVTARDRVVLFASDTPQGQASALAVVTYLRSQLAGLDAVAVSVPGLQVQDAALFQRKGLANFFRLARVEINQARPGGCSLVITGGFKALIPYAVLLATLENLTCYSVFEHSDSLITLPPLPLTIDRETLLPFLPLLRAMAQDGSVPLKKLEATVPDPLFRDQLASLIEIFPDENRVGLSTLGILVLDALQ